MDRAAALEFARSTQKSVLVTARRNGRPQLSNVLHRVGDDGVIRISITADRAKYFNLKRDPWAALHVTRDDFWAYAVVEGDVELSPIAAAVDDATVEELVDHYRGLQGEHDDWDAFRRSQVDDRRLVVRIKPTHVYGMLP